MTSPSATPHTQDQLIEWERKPKTIDANLKDYDATYRTFNW